ncbi:MAG TPA: rRNA adenine N(6)-methyltransferase family protein [Beutenbergiaceae bacterium]|nr:rRNA adenine N(6)-methyltransferase family protein [Beutenbergiaceae bacterium]
MPPTFPGGPHERGENLLTHRPTLTHLGALAARTTGSILEIGTGSGLLTRRLAELGRPLTTIDIDPGNVRRARRRLPHVEVLCADALEYRLAADTIIGNLPFHLTTPILRRLLREPAWGEAILLIQWEVARKRAGVGGGTMMTGQAAPWFTFVLHGRVPAHHFSPVPSVDAGILGIRRRTEPLIPHTHRAGYERFVRAVFTSRGRTFPQLLGSVTRLPPRAAKRLVASAGIRFTHRPRDLTPEQWCRLWRATRAAADKVST